MSKIPAFADSGVFDALTPESSYWLGIIMSDGFVHNKVVGLSMIDKDHVTKFRSFLKAANPVREYMPSIGNRLAYDLRVTNQELVSKLSNYNIVQNKSLTATVPSALESNSHFWRGMIDGDGCFTISEGRAAFTYCGSGAVCQSLMDYMKSFSDFKGSVRPVKNGNAFLLGTRGKYVKVLINKIYVDSTDDIRLTRKYNKALELLALPDSIKKDRFCSHCPHCLAAKNQEFENNDIYLSLPTQSA